MNRSSPDSGHNGDDLADLDRHGGREGFHPAQAELVPATERGSGLVEDALPFAELDPGLIDLIARRRQARGRPDVWIAESLPRLRFEELADDLFRGSSE